MIELPPYPTGSFDLPDDPTPEQLRVILQETLRCALSWEPGARLVGNVRAGDMAAALSRVLQSDEIGQALRKPGPPLMGCEMMGCDETENPCPDCHVYRKEAKP